MLRCARTLRRKRSAAHARAPAIACAHWQATRRMDSARARASSALQPLAERAMALDSRAARADGARAQAAAVNWADNRGHRSNVAFLSAGSAPVDARRIRDGTLVTATAARVRISRAAVVAPQEPFRKPPGIDVNVIVREDVEKARQDAEFNGMLAQRAGLERGPRLRRIARTEEGADRLRADFLR